jgi:KaiC/GvpD/RAD55 family RecA-like ATPase
MEKLDGHVGILYGSAEGRLVDHVMLFLCENLANEHPVLIVATPAHRNVLLTAFQAAGVETDAAIARGNLVCLDAVTTLEKLLIDGRIDWRAFDRYAGELVRNLRMRGPLRIYGEIVGILWALGRHEMAIDLELHWKRLLRRVDFSLMCAYEIDVSSPEFSQKEIAAIVGTHDRLLTCGGPSAA